MRPDINTITRPASGSLGTGSGGLGKMSRGSPILHEPQKIRGKSAPSPLPTPPKYCNKVIWKMFGLGRVLERECPGECPGEYSGGYLGKCSGEGSGECSGECSGRLLRKMLLDISRARPHPKAPCDSSGTRFFHPTAPPTSSGNPRD
jgi:hypothetical protein